MKKLYKLFLASALSACVLVSMHSRVSAQIVGVQGKSAFSTPKGIPAGSGNAEWNHPANNSRTITSNWLGYWFAADSNAVTINGITNHAFWIEPLFDDSTVIVKAPTFNYRPYLHLAGNVFDPGSNDMQTTFNYSWSYNNSYTIDSMEVAGLYKRTTSSAIVDTLIIYLWTDLNLSNQTIFVGGHSCVPAVDTVWCPELFYDSTGTNMPKSTALTTIKVPLHEADSANFYQMFSTNNFAVPAHKILASAVRFKPGYSYVAGDTLSKNKNTFYMESIEPNGDTTLNIYTKFDFNMSYSIPTDVRYNLDHRAGGWDGMFVTSYAWAAASGLDVFRINYLVTGTFDVGINESNSLGGIKLYQNQPNPSNQTTLIRYETQAVSAVTLEVRDVTGRLVMELNQGTQSIGKHAAVIDVSKLSKGMYLYTLKTNNESLTRRMIVSE